MLINCDYMENTSFDPDEYDISQPGYKSLTVDDFTQLLIELKENNPDADPSAGGCAVRSGLYHRARVRHDGLYPHGKSGG